MIIRKLRLEQGWTQQELAQYGGLSIRTVQRIEKGQLPSEETAKCLGAVFGVESQDILDYYTHHQQPTDNGGSQEQRTMSKISLSLEEERVMREVEELKDFYKHALTFVVIITFLWIINFITSTAYWWAIWPTLGWGLGLAFHAVGVFNLFTLFSPEWERKEINKRLRHHD